MKNPGSTISPFSKLIYFFLFFLAVCLFQIPANAQLTIRHDSLKKHPESSLYPFRKKDKWGYCDSLKKMVIEPIYESATIFSDKGFAIAKLRGKYGLINKKGDSVTRFVFDSYELLTNERILISINRNCGLINELGKVIIPVEYDQLMYESWAPYGIGVHKNDKWAIFSALDGHAICPFRYDDIRICENGLIAVGTDHKWGFMDTSGIQTIEPQFEDVSRCKCHRAAFLKDHKWGFIDETGKTVIPPIYDSNYHFHQVYDFQKEGVWVEKNNKWGLLDSLGEEIVPFIYDDVNYFKDGLASVKKNDKWGFIDPRGKPVTSFVYSFADYYSEGVAFVCKDNKCGYIDRTAKTVIKFDLDKSYTSGFNYGIAIVVKNDKWGVINKTGKVIIPLKYLPVADYCNFNGKTGHLHVFSTNPDDLDRNGFYFTKTGTLLYEE